MKSKLTSSAKQTLLFFEEFIRKKEVKEFIKQYRKHLNLPENGLPVTEEELLKTFMTKSIKNTMTRYSS